MRLPKCELCDMPAVKSSIIGDIYYKSLCLADYDRLIVDESTSSGEAAYNRDRDFEDHEADVRQPYAGGKADFEFMRLYRDTAKKMFTDDEIQAAERS